MTRTKKKIEVWRISNIIDGPHAGYDEQRSRAKHMRTWITAVWNPVHWRPEGRKNLQIWVYNKLLEQQTNSANPIPAGEIMGAVRALQHIASIYPSRLCEVRATGGRWWCFLSSYLFIGLQPTRWYWKYQSGRKHELTKRHDETSWKGKDQRYSKLAPDVFSTCEVWAHDGGSDR